MRFRTSNCIALGVENRAEAVRMYTEVLGFTATKEGGNWTELESGALKLYIVEDDVRLPCFDMIVEDIEQARQHLSAAGWVQVDLNPGEVFMRDPFGYAFCISKEQGM